METVNLTANPASLGNVKRDYAAGSIQTAADTRKGGEADKAGASAQDVNMAVDQLKSFVKDAQRNLDFSVDDSSGQFVVKVMDGDSGKMIRQIPSEELLRLSEQLDNMRSLLFKAEA
ncbi:flagellar protein FlaG [Stutzerimonas nitrititolerans]|uniref:flagellar protein FlaG n=1 Tax=Stutzerimonas nitrititolerans TaxID=2482751 RepID=UPI0028981E1E|nr:flagellar protein FlaG [Stutzerimonas nitrititolerans]